MTVEVKVPEGMFNIPETPLLAVNQMPFSTEQQNGGYAWATSWLRHTDEPAVRE